MGAGILLLECTETGQGVAELARFVEQHAAKERGTGDVVGRRVADQCFQPGFLVRIILEFVRLLECFDGGLLILGVIGQHSFIVNRRLGLLV